MPRPRGQPEPYRLSAVLDGLPWPVMALRPDLTVAYVSEAYRDAFGGDPRGLLGWSLEQLDAPWNCPALRRTLADLAAADGDGQPREVAVPNHRSLRVVCMAMPPCDIGAAGLLLFVDDRRAHGRLEAQVRELNQRLEAALAKRTTQVHEQAVQLRELTAELLDAETRERERLAEQLHDHLQQLLVAAQLRLHLLDKLPSPERAAAVGAEVRAVLQQAIDASRSLAMELSPPLPQGSGLASGLRWLAQHFRQQYNLTVTLRLDSVPEEVSPPLLVFTFRAVRELLFNVVKHADVDEATITAGGGSENHLRLIIEDHGRGCAAADLESPSPGFGLAVIRQRAAALGGQCELQSSPGDGCRIALELPLTSPLGTG